MKKICALLLLTLVVSQLYAQQTFYQKTITTKKLPLSWVGGAPYIVKHTADSGLVFSGVYFDAGTGNNTMFLMKFNSSFIVEWSYALYVADAPIPYALVQTKDDGYAITGSYTDQPGESAAFVLKLNKTGKPQWQKYFKQASLTSAYSVSEDKTGNLFVSGKSDDGIGSSDFWVTKIIRTGDVTLNKIYELTGYNTYETQIISTKDNGFAIVGIATPNSFVVKVDTLGTPQWTKLIKEELTPYRFDISESGNKELTIAASRSNDLLAFKVDKNGNTKWSKLISASGKTDVNDLLQLSSGNVLVSVILSDASNQIDILKIDNATGTVTVAKNLKTTAGNTFNFLNKKSETEYTATGWDASAGTNVINTINVDSSLQNCTDNAVLFSGIDYTFTDSVAATVAVSTLTELVSSVSGGAWVNPTKVDTVCSEVVLPLRLLRFTLAKNGAANILSWSTAEEINTSYFEVQRGTNNTSFTAIAKVMAGKNKIQNDYQFTDARPLNGANYYRLKIVDADGKFSFSPILLSSNNKSIDVVVYPNPVKDRIVLNINSKVKTSFNVTVSDMQGRILLTTSINVEEGISKREINAASLKQGTYYVRMESSEGSQVIKIIK